MKDDIPQIDVHRPASQGRRRQNAKLLGLSRFGIGHRAEVLICIAGVIYAVSAAFWIFASLLGVADALSNGEGLRSLAGLFLIMVLMPIATVAVVAAFMLPSIVAYYRSHRNLIPLLIANVFIGFTGLGWVVCAAWSFWTDEGQRADPARARRQDRHPPPPPHWDEQPNPGTGVVPPPVTERVHR